MSAILQFLSAVGVGALAVKLMDVLWLQRVLQKHEQRSWLRDKRLAAYSRLAGQLMSLGLCGIRAPNPFEWFGSASEAMLLMDNDALVDRIDRYIVDLDQLYHRGDDKSPESCKQMESLYVALTKEARLIVKELRNELLKAE
jgi:hypothetical protein